MAELQILNMLDISSLAIIDVRINSLEECGRRFTPDTTARGKIITAPGTPILPSKFEVYLFRVNLIGFYTRVERILEDFLNLFDIHVDAWRQENGRHSWHINVLKAFDDPCNPLHAILGQGKMRGLLWWAKDFRNAWKSAKSDPNKCGESWLVMTRFDLQLYAIVHGLKRASSYSLGLLSFKTGKDMSELRVEMARFIAMNREPIQAPDEEQAICRPKAKGEDIFEIDEGRTTSRPTYKPDETKLMTRIQNKRINTYGIDQMRALSSAQDKGGKDHTSNSLVQALPISDDHVGDESWTCLLRSPSKPRYKGKSAYQANQAQNPSRPERKYLDTSTLAFKLRGYTEIIRCTTMPKTDQVPLTPTKGDKIHSFNDAQPETQPRDEIDRLYFITQREPTPTLSNNTATPSILQPQNPDPTLLKKPYFLTPPACTFQNHQLFSMAQIHQPQQTQSTTSNPMLENPEFIEHPFHNQFVSIDRLTLYG